MIIEEKKYGFKTARVILDDAEALRAKDRGYDRLIVVSHNELSLPGYRIQKKETGIIDLEGKTKEDVLAGFGKTTRNEISRTFRDPDFAFAVEDEISLEAYALYLRFEKALGRTPFARETFSGCLSFCGYYRTELVSVIFVFPSEPARVRSIFSKRRSLGERGVEYNNVSYAGRRLMYEVCVWGIETKKSGIDLAALNFTDAGKHGITEYKMSFNPRVVREYTYTYSKPLYRICEQIIRVTRLFS